jgi:hypothetical protein
MFAALAIYCLLLFAAIWFGHSMPKGPWRTLVLVSPMLGFLLMIWAVVRQFRRSDEFIRKSTLENVTIAAAVTAGCTFTYGFLEMAGYPHLSMFTVWPLMGATWFVIGLIRNLCER